MLDVVMRERRRKGTSMFVQVIQGNTREEPAELRRQWEMWDEQLKGGAGGFLGSTAGVTADGRFIALVRFDSESAASANSGRSEQDEWWRQTAQHIENPMFHDCPVVDLMDGGGSDDAGFVQVIQGKVTDVDRARELDREMQGAAGAARPDLIGGVVAWHLQNGRFTNAIYFTSEEEARANEQEMSNAPEFQKFMSEYQAISDGELEYLDLTDPWFSSP